MFFACYLRMAENVDAHLMRTGEREIERDRARGREGERERGRGERERESSGRATNIKIEMCADCWRTNERTNEKKDWPSSPCHVPFQPAAAIPSTSSWTVAFDIVVENTQTHTHTHAAVCSFNVVHSELHGGTRQEKNPGTVADIECKRDTHTHTHDWTEWLKSQRDEKSCTQGSAAQLGWLASWWRAVKQTDRNVAKEES